jgi:hypothetical protein
MLRLLKIKRPEILVAFCSTRASKYSPKEERKTKVGWATRWFEGGATSLRLYPLIVKAIDSTELWQSLTGLSRAPETQGWEIWRCPSTTLLALFKRRKGLRHFRAQLLLPNQAQQLFVQLLSQERSHTSSAHETQDLLEFLKPSRLLSRRS